LPTVSSTKPPTPAKAESSLTDCWVLTAFTATIETDGDASVDDTDIAPARVASRARQHAGKPLRQALAQYKPKFRDRSTPPPPNFDFEKLADGTKLTQVETAAVLRRAVSCLENWRKDPAHPLKWQYVAGRVLYTAGAIRKFRKATAIRRYRKATTKENGRA
jgi:hypothetical protein